MRWEQSVGMVRRSPIHPDLNENFYGGVGSLRWGRFGLITTEPSDRPHFRPHISATPRDETDKEQHVSLKTKDIRHRTDTQQPSDSSFQSQGAGVEIQTAHKLPTQTLFSIFHLAGSSQSPSDPSGLRSLVVPDRCVVNNSVG